MIWDGELHGFCVIFVLVRKRDRERGQKEKEKEKKCSVQCTMYLQSCKQEKIHSMQMALLFGSVCQKTTISVNLLHTCSFSSSSIGLSDLLSGILALLPHTRALHSIVWRLAGNIPWSQLTLSYDRYDYLSSRESIFLPVLFLSSIYYFWSNRLERFVKSQIVPELPTLDCSGNEQQRKPWTTSQSSTWDIDCLYWLVCLPFGSCYCHLQLQSIDLT